MVRTERFLVADIGGTNARFAVSTLTADGAVALLDTEIWPTLDLGDGARLYDRLAGRFDLEAVTAAVIGIAGPVQRQRCAMTNAPLVVDGAALGADLGVPTVVLNDFEALAEGVPAFRQLIAVGGRAGAPGSRAVIGAGSGLGMALLLPDGPGRWRVAASEGGYGDLPATSPLEAEVLALLQQELPHVSWETVLSGPGLVRLYRALAQIWGEAPAPTPITPDWITASAIDAQVPLCHQTVELFLSWLGAAAGNLALTGCAFGGVYLGGGIAPRLAPQLLASPFRRRFEARGALSEIIAETPVYLILDELPALIGATLHAARPGT